MRVLVSGAQGWLGWFTVAACLRTHPTAEVFGFGRSPALGAFTHRLADGRRAPLPPALQQTPRDPRYQYLQADLCDAGSVQALVRTVRPDTILHLAGGLPGGTAEALAAVNVAGSRTLVRAAESARARVVFASTGSLYGDPVRVPQDEDHPAEGITDYARSKWAGEQAARAEAEARRVPLVIGRIFNGVGPGQPRHFLPGSLAAQLADITLGTAPPVVRMGPLHTTRDYIDVRDVAAAMVQLGHQASPGTTVNLASGIETPIQAVWDTLLAAARRRGSRPVRVDRLPPRPANVRRQVGDTRRMRAAGIPAGRSLEDSLGDLMDYALSAARTA